MTSKKRINHYISTAKFMKKVASKYGINEERAYTVGLLHDLGRELNIDEIKELAIKFDSRDIIKIVNLEKKLETPIILHGAASAEILAEKLDGVDNEILEAVYYHTLGGVGLSNLAKLLYIADFCEPKRDYRESKIVRRLLDNQNDSADNNLLLAYYFSYYYSIRYTLKTGVIFYKDTIDAYNSVLEEIKKRELVIDKKLI